MCAQLTGNDSNFLPFNKGYNYGKGYPVNPNGHKSAYLPLYSMKQVIEEKFILDVLANYTTYKSYYEVQKSVEENPLFNTVKHRKSLRLLSRPARKLLR